MKALYNCAGNMIALCSPEDDEGTWKYDQLIFFTLVNDHLLEVKIFNSDGSLAGNCLNGMRALAHFCYTELKLTGTLDFVQNKILLAKGEIIDEAVFVQVNFPKLNKGESHFEVDVGNKHSVFKRGTSLPSNPKNYIPKMNEEYIQEIFGNEITVRVFEAGVGETGSCGSGAVAVGVYAFNELGLSKIMVKYPGGDLQVRVENNKIYLSGPIFRQE